MMPLGPQAPRRIPDALELRLTGEHLAITLEDAPADSGEVRAWYDPLFGGITLRGPRDDVPALAYDAFRRAGKKA